ncbi:GNAT family N-acetyltransferase [Algoriphagus sp.]|uniref:GNAT family N-acetyltransferase n=1 Tax=Algoriphagus sp. TaxID=1872435 RepID=UPI002629D575|nr:GNAT family N-acetyltransferase [Algoriphagus sp.]
MSLLVEKVTGNKGLELAFKIRREVFVDEQGVNPEDEYDEFEGESVHFLASKDGKPVGTARWRFTDYGIKMERFAVRKEARGKGVGEALVTAVLRDIMVHPEAKGKKRYLHAQLQAVPLYSKFGFQKVGDMFEECAIQHYKMELA